MEDVIKSAASCGLTNLGFCLISKTHGELFMKDLIEEVETWDV